MSGLLNSIGVKAVALTSPVTLYAGQVYYLGLSTGAQGTSIVSLEGLSPFPSQADDTFGTGAGDILFDMKTSAHPLPDPWVSAGSSAAGFLLQALEM